MWELNGDFSRWIWWGGASWVRVTCSQKRGSKVYWGDFPCGAVVKNPPANAGDVGSSPGPGRSHMLGSN